LLGGRLAELALERGSRVRSLARREWAGEPWVPVKGRFLGKLPDGVPAASLAGVDSIVHCAAIDTGPDSNIFDVNVHGSVNLARLARKAGVRSFIYVSSSSARPDALSAYGLSKYAAEQELSRLTGIDLVIVRPNLIVGRNRGTYGRLCRIVDTLPVIPVLGGGMTRVQPIHVDDLCGSAGATHRHHPRPSLANPCGCACSGTDGAPLAGK
jgi:nucleoside-diphosphate-sugar epimerase